MGLNRDFFPEAEVGGGLLRSLPVSLTILRTVSHRDRYTDTLGCYLCRISMVSPSITPTSFAGLFFGKIVPEFMAVVRVGDIKTINRAQPVLKVSRLQWRDDIQSQAMFVDGIGNNLVNVSRLYA